jgi:hypothetical protein
MKVFVRDMVAQAPLRLSDMLILLLARQMTGAIVRWVQTLARRAAPLRYWRPAPLASWARQREW